ncbi:MAG: hypothetical protein ACFFDN_50485, partial [Candidatus Hodarchaeota archaeon]
MSERARKKQVLKELEEQIENLRGKIRENIIKNEEQIKVINEIDKKIDIMKSEVFKLSEKEDDQAKLLASKMHEYDYLLGQKIDESENLNSTIKELQKNLDIKDKEIKELETEIGMMKEEFSKEMNRVLTDKEDLLSKAKLVYKSSEKDKANAIRELESKYEEIRKNYESQIIKKEKDWKNNFQEQKNLYEK